jgi:hypothetical protein
MHLLHLVHNLTFPQVVILDCQHFYKMALKDHHRFIELLVSAFRGKLLPFNSDMKHLTLNYITETCNSQVILIYRSSNVFKWFLWPSHSFPTPWPNTVSIPYLISFITGGLKQRDLSWGFVTQCVLTPTLWFACRFLFSEYNDVGFSDIFSFPLRFFEESMRVALGTRKVQLVETSKSWSGWYQHRHFRFRRI